MKYFNFSAYENFNYLLKFCNIKNNITAVLVIWKSVLFKYIALFFLFNKGDWALEIKEHRKKDGCVFS